MEIKFTNSAYNPKCISGTKCGAFVSVRGVGDDKKTYLGIFLGEIAMEAFVYPEHEKDGVVPARYYNNPAMFVPDLNKVIFGYESWWGEIESEEQLRQITDDDIQNVWYVRALKAIQAAKKAKLQSNLDEIMSNALTCETCPGFVTPKGYRCQRRGKSCNGTWDMSTHKCFNGEQIMVMGRVARQRINVEVRMGRRVHPNTLVCIECGHLGTERRHEYHHHLGYAAEHHHDVVAICTTCHAKQHPQIENRTRGKDGKFAREYKIKRNAGHG